MVGPKPLLTEFGIHQRLEGCEKHSILQCSAIFSIPDTVGVKSGKTALAPRRLLFKPKPEFAEENPIPEAVDEDGSEKSPRGDSGLP